MSERTLSGMVGKCFGILAGLNLSISLAGAAGTGRSVENGGPLVGSAGRVVEALAVGSGASRAVQQSSTPQAASPSRAGAVVDAIPEEVVERTGTPSALPLKVNDPVFWQDIVKTIDNGRVRIQLLDSSVLNIGVRSVMKVVQHDPQSQQTQLELTLGSLRGEVKKLTSQTGKFEIQTPTAVIGVVGTVFEVESSETATHVHVLEGRVKVRHRDPKFKGTIIVPEGHETLVHHNAPLAKPTRVRNYKQEVSQAKQHRQQQRALAKQPMQQEKQLQQPNPSSKKVKTRFTNTRAIPKPTRDLH